MTSALSAEQRTSLERLIQDARQSIEEDLERSLEGKYGINADGRIEAQDTLSLSNAEFAVRVDLVEIVEFLRSEGEDAEASVARLVREAAFTHTNRLIAVRVAEAIGLLPETMAKGVASAGFRDFGEVAPTVAVSEWGRFAEFVRLCADELATDVPALFDPRNPLIALEMSEAVLEDVVEAISSFDDDLWAAPDTLGWAYQFFNTGEERKEMRDASAAPRTSRELAVRNQFFTPSYVVEFLVHNGLGAHLAAGFPGLADELPLLVEVPTEQIDVDLEAVSVLDPAVGSGHFLLGAYDVLEKAWQHAGVEPADAAPAIVRSLWGIDIDPRATQIAQAAVMFRARRHCRDEKLPAANVICARSLPTGPEVDALIASLPEHVGRAVQGIADGLVDAPVLGPLLKIEERLSLEVRDVFGTGVIEGTLSEAASHEVDNIEVAVLDALTDIADSTTSSAAERLFAAEAHDAVRFVEAMARRYDAVLMNPPFGLCVDETQAYLRSTFLGWTDLFGCFLERGLELRSTGGEVGILMPNTFFNTRKMRSLRERLIRDRDIGYVFDLGAGVLEDAAVEVAAVLLKRSDKILYVDAVHAPHEDREQFALRFSDFAEQSTAADYDDGDSYLLTFRREATDQASSMTIDPTYALVRTGGNTFDNFRFVRLWWELGSKTPEGWVMYFKGGEFFPYSYATRLVVDWKNDGASLKALGEERGVLPQVMQSSKHWRKAGLTYPRVGKKFGARLMPPGGIFSEKSVAILPNELKDADWILGLLNSSPTAAYFSEIGRGRFVENSWVKGVPVDSPALDISRTELETATSELVAVFTAVDALDETSPLFQDFPHPADLLSTIDAAALRAESLQAEIDNLSADIVRRPRNEDHPSEVAEALQVLGSLDDIAFRKVSFEVGRCFGRWDRDEDAPELLLQSPGSQLHLPSRVELRLPAEEFSNELKSLGCSEFFGRGGINEFFRTRFFRRHLAMYSMSRRKAPIYWQLQVPSKTWGIWLYAPRLSREMLFAVVRETEQRQRLAEQQIGHLEREAETGGGGRKASEVAKELEVEQKLAVELKSFRAEAERIANLGWEPDLDDGMVLNAAPLADLFPAWKDAAKYRKELRAGKHEWATVAQFADQL